MKPPRTIQYKALFLLVTFSMNTVIGFACSIGVDMGFNSSHHSHEAGEQHGHSDAEHHDEHDGNNSHSHSHSHQHEAISHHHSDIDNNTVSFSSKDEENCCRDFVADFNSLDKQIANQSNTQLKITNLSPFILSAFITEAKNVKGYIQHIRIPPREIDYSPPDIRVFIKSFLI